MNMKMNDLISRRVGDTRYPMRSTVLDKRRKSTFAKFSGSFVGRKVTNTAGGKKNTDHAFMKRK